MKLVAAAVAATIVLSAAAKGEEWGNPYFGRYWMHACTEEAMQPLCYAYIMGLQGTNEYMTFVAKHPIWCETAGVTLDQLRLIFLKTLNEEVSRVHEEPASGIAILGFMKSFPCRKAH